MEIERKERNNNHVTEMNKNHHPRVCLRTRSLILDKRVLQQCDLLHLLSISVILSLVGSLKLQIARAVTIYSR